MALRVNFGYGDRQSLNGALSMDESLHALVSGGAGYAFAFLLGALLGSFANVCIARIPLRMSIVRPPSHCFACQAPVAWYDNLPILSYLILRGRCRRCGAGYSPRYLMVELVTGLLLLGTWHLSLFVWGAGEAEAVPHRLARFAIYALFELALVVIAMIDLDHKQIYDRITYPAIPIFFGLGQLLGDVSWQARLVGVAVGYGVVRAIADLYWFLARREGLGYGDGKLLALIGALLGWEAVLFGLFGGALLGSVIGVAAIVARRPGADGTPVRQMEIPFGPFIVSATLFYMVIQTRLSLSLLLLPT